MSQIADISHGFAFGEALYPQGGVFGPLTDRYLSLVLVHEGRVTVTCDDTVTTLDEGHCAFFFNERNYSSQFDGNRRARVSWCEATPSNLPESLALRVRCGTTRIVISQRLGSLMRMGVELGSKFGTNINMFRNALGEAVFLAFFYEAGLWEEALNTPPSLQVARQFVDDNFARDLTVSQLARRASVTPQHLIALFKKHVGVTPGRYLWRKRTERSQFLLLHTELTIAEIAYQCGYKNPFHFSRQIKQRFGMTPKQIRSNRGYRTPAEIAENKSGMVVKAEGRREWLGQVAAGVSRH